MERPSLEVSGASTKPESKENVGEFDWHEFEPPWIKTMREAAQTDPAYAEQLKEREAQMDAIADLAHESDVEFRGKLDTESTDLLAEEGVISANEVEFHRKKERMWNSPLPLMISWGRENGVITSDEAKKLHEWFKPEL